MVFIYSELFRPYVTNKVLGRLFLPTIDLEMFSPPAPDSVRSMVCYYLGKTSFKAGFFDPKNCFEITRDSPKRSELPKLFRASKLLYSFDTCSALNHEAIACGCPVLLIPDGAQKKTDYDKAELGLNGMAWGLDEFQSELKVDQALFQRQAKAIEARYPHDLDAFVRIVTGATVVD
jgi:hypothetical protein